jgi:hypothetical protein
MRDKKDSAQQDAGRNFQRTAKPILTEYEKVRLWRSKPLPRDAGHCHADVAREDGRDHRRGDRGTQSRLRKFERVDKWSFCLKAAMIAANRRDHEQTTAPGPQPGF